MTNVDIKKIEGISHAMRRKIIDVSFSCGTSAHIGGGLSMVDLLATLYGSILNFKVTDPRWVERDRFILSKGHGILGLISALRVTGVISEEVFNSFQSNESHLIAHPIMNLDLGIESSNGSLGHGLSLGVGLAIAAKKLSKSHHIFVLLGDGECNEGSIWESVMAASQFKLDNLTVIIDKNGYQNEAKKSKNIISRGSNKSNWESFGWETYNIDGHDIKEIYDAFTIKRFDFKPKAIIAKTVKGKGISFMENNNDWHHNRLTQVKYDLAIKELNCKDS